MSNLPPELTSFVGRQQELAQIRRLLESSRLVTLTGPGGAGKTRLAIRSARRLGRHFPDGAVIVELAEVDDGALVAYAIARPLGILESAKQAVEDRLLAFLAERRLLLVLDNCEHVLTSCRALATRIQSSCPRTRLLCTSRERLGVVGEVVVPVWGLAVPDRGAAPVASATYAESLQLLADRTAAITPDFALGAANIEAASEICCRLDGQPLAIELAAVRMASMSPQDLLPRLDNRLALLRREHDSQPERAHGLRATVEWSYELCSDEERVLWSRLSVFAGGFSLLAAEDVCSGAGLERHRIVELIGGLVAKSILLLEHKGHGRYRLLETLRVYGAERLVEADEEVTLRSAHAAWYGELISGGGRPWWASPRQGEVLEMLDVEWANVEAALDFSAASPCYSAVGLGMAADLWLYWMIRSRYRAGRKRLEALLATQPEPCSTRAMALVALGCLVQATGDFASAFAVLEESRLVGTQVGGDRELAYTLLWLGVVNGRAGNSGLARDLLAEAHERMLQVDDAFGPAWCHFFLAEATAAAGQFDQARGLLIDGLAGCQRAGDQIGRGMVNALLGCVEWQLGDTLSAEARLKEALTAQSLTVHRWGMITSLEGLAWVAWSSGQPERAALMLGAAEGLCQQVGIAMMSYWQTQHDACALDLRARLGDAGYSDRWQQGRALSRDRVIAAALGTPTSTATPPVANASKQPGLSERELRVAQLVAGGLSNPAIATELFVSVATVKTHVSHILQKLSLGTRAQIAVWVAEHDSATMVSTVD